MTELQAAIAATRFGHVHLSGGNWGGPSVYQLRPRAV